MSELPMRGHFRYLCFKTFPMTPRTPQCEVFCPLLSSSEHSGVPEDSQPPTFPSVGLHPHTWPKWGCDIDCRYFADHMPNMLPLGNDFPKVLPERHNSDKGRLKGWHNEFLDLCRSLGLFILNGRIAGNELGECTCFANGGSCPQDTDTQARDLDPFRSCMAISTRQNLPYQ